MAELYKQVRGEKFNDFLAAHVNKGIWEEAFKVFDKAQGNLTEVRASPAYTGAYHVDLRYERGTGKQKNDVYIILDDDGTIPGAAWSIEYGHYAGPQEKKHRRWVEGKWILHDAAGIPRRRR